MGVIALVNPNKNNTDTLYLIVRDGTTANPIIQSTGLADATPTDAERANYDWPCVNTSEGFAYTCDLDGLPAGSYTTELWQMAGAAPAIGADELLATGSLLWDGSAQTQPASADAVASSTTRSNDMSGPLRHGTVKNLTMSEASIASGETSTSDAIDLREYAGALVEVYAINAGDQAAGAELYVLGSGDGSTYETEGQLLGTLDPATGAHVMMATIPAGFQYVKVSLYNPGLSAVGTITLRWWPIMGQSNP